MTEAAGREMCCQGNGLQPFAVGAEVLIGDSKSPWHRARRDPARPQFVSPFFFFGKKTGRGGGRGV